MPSNQETRRLGSLTSLDVQTAVSEIADQNSDARWGVYQAGGDDHPIGQIGQLIEQAVFLEEYGIPPIEMAAEFGPFNSRSVWSLIVHHESMRPVAAVRHMVGPARHLKAAIDISDYWGMTWDDAAAGAGYDPDGQFVEACTYSVLREWRTADRAWPTKISVAVQSHMVTDLGSKASVQIINPRVVRVFKAWRMPFIPIGAAVDIKGADFEAAFIPRVPGSPWMRSSDSEFVELFRNRSEAGRGGTRLQPIDLDGSVAERHNRAVFASDGIALPGASTLNV